MSNLMSYVFYKYLLSNYDLQAYNNHFLFVFTTTEQHTFHISEWETDEIDVSHKCFRFFIGIICYWWIMFWGMQLLLLLGKFYHCLYHLWQKHNEFHSHTEPNLSTKLSLLFQEKIFLFFRDLKPSHIFWLYNPLHFLG